MLACSARRAFVLAAGLATVLCATATATAPPTILPAGSFVFDGQVTAVTHSGGNIFVSGAFRGVRKPTGGGLIVSATGSGGADPAQFPQVAGAVLDVAADGSGGWFVGGDFTHVGGLARSGLAHILADRTVDPAWNPAPNGTADTLVVSGSTVYVGGDFTSVGGQPRHRLAALSATTGDATSWDPSPDDTVLDLAVAGSTVYAAGRFSSIGGKSRTSIAALDATTGDATAWNPDPGDGYVYALAVSGSTVYAGGEFASIGGQARDRLAALDASTGDASAWDPSPDAEVYALTLSGATLYVGGAFQSIAGSQRGHIAAFEASGDLSAWDPGVGGPVYGLAVSGSTAFVAGVIAKTENDPTGGQQRGGFAALDTTTGNATSWDPNAAGYGYAVAASGSTVYAGGNFAGAGDPLAMVSGIAKLDAAGDLDTGWSARVQGSADALALSGSTLYVGGSFYGIGGQPRSNLAAVDVATGDATSWDPNSAAQIQGLALSGSTVYVSGYFGTIGSDSPQLLRRRLAAVDRTTGKVTAWSAPVNRLPSANDAPGSLAFSGSRVYVAESPNFGPLGRFSQINGTLRNGLAALDPVTGAVSAWNPSPSSGSPINSVVRALAFSGSTVYAGGTFASIGGQSRAGLAALDPLTGNAMAWNPSANGGVSALAVSGSTVYAGGTFTAVGGQPRKRLAALDAATGALRAWDPQASGGVEDKFRTSYVTALDPGAIRALDTSDDGSSVYVAGTFTSLNGTVTGPFAVVADGSASAHSASARSAAPAATAAPPAAARQRVTRKTSRATPGDAPAPAVRSADVSDASISRAPFSATAAQISPPTGYSPLAAVGNLNADDFPDVMTVGGAIVAGGPNVTVRLNDGAGMFTAPRTAIFADAPSTLGLVDLNGDGQTDATMTGDGALSLIKRKGTRWFFPESFAVDGYVGSLATGDLNGDGKLDLAVVSRANDSSPAAVTLFIRVTPIGVGSTVAPADYAQVNLPFPAEGPTGVAIGDLDGDGDADLAVALNTGHAMGIYTRAGDGLAASDYTLSTFPLPADDFPVAMTVGDLDGDGRPDLVTANNNPPARGGTVSVLLRDPAGGFRPAQSLATAPGDAQTIAVAIGDLDGDGRPDIVAANRNDNGGSVTALLKDATGDGYTNTTIPTAQLPGSIALADVYGAGRLDAVVGGNPGAAVLRNTTPQATSFALDGPSGGSVFGDGVSFSSSAQRVVAGLRGSSALGGSVTYKVDSRVLAPVALPGSGLVGLSTSALGVGSHTVRADYSGDANYAGGSDSRTQVVTAATTIGPGDVTGPLAVSGSTFVTGAHITGDVTVAPGATLDMEDSTIDGDVTASGAGAIRMCGTRVNGSVSISGSAGLVVVGDIEHAMCAVNTITGDLSFEDNVHGVMSIADSVGGGVSSDGNSGPGPFPGDVTTIAQSSPRPVARLSASEAAFEDTTIGQTSAAVSVTVKNVGLAALTVSGVSVTGADQTQFEVAPGGGCDAPIAPDAQCTVDVAFKPTSKGEKTAALQIASDTPSSPSTVALTGKGLLAPILDLSVLGAAFANTLVGAVSEAQEVSVTNDGETALQISAIAFDGAGAGQFSLDAGSCANALIAAGAQCSVRVAFAPTVAGVQSADLAFSSNASTSPDTLTVSGTAIAPTTPPPPPAQAANPPPPPPPPPVAPKLPSNVVRLAKVTAAAHGAITLMVKVPGPGRLAASSSARIAAKSRKAKARTVTYGRVVSATIKRASTVTLRIKPGALAKVLLRHAKRLPVTVTVTYTPTGGKRAKKTTHTTARR
jgi:hypothetical protein